MNFYGLGGVIAMVAVVAAVIGISVYAILGKYFKTKQAAAEAGVSESASAIRDNLTINRQLLSRVESLDNRLAAVEKTLTAIE